MPGLTVLRVVNNTDLRQAEEKRALEEMQARQNDPVITGLAGHIKSCWQAAKDAKNPIETLMLKCKRQRAGQYESDRLTEITRNGGSNVFMRITETKCRAAESWVRDILLDSGAPPWDLQPTPLPSLPPEYAQQVEQTLINEITGMVMSLGQAPSPEQQGELQELIAQDLRFKLLQAAQNKADLMANKIKDQFAEGGWYEAFNNFVTDLTTYPAAIIKGPIIRRQRKLAWKQGANGTEIQTTEEIGPEYERVDPFHFFPEPGIADINDGYCFQHHPLSRPELSDMIGLPNFDDDAIRDVLENGGPQTWFSDNVELTKAELERRYSAWRSPTVTYDALEFWGKISGKMLVEWGMSNEEVPDEAKEYDACVWTIGDKVIKAVLNYDPLGEKPYAKTSFFKVPGAFWGMGIPEVIEDIQNICNASARALVNNMGIASGPQVEVNTDRLAPNEDITQMFPWKIWQTLSDPTGNSQPAINFKQPDDRAASLMGVYEKFSQMADEHSGIPAYVSGDISVTGAGRTSSGLSMLMGAAGKGIRQVVSHIDNDVIKTIVQRQFVFNMRYDEDESIKGDVVVVPRGAVNLAVKETLNVRRVEFLTATANPIDMEIIGLEGRASILREVSKGLQMPTEDIVPSREKLAMKGKAAQMAPPPQQGGSPEKPTPTFADGSFKGGQAGNLVSNSDTGVAA